MKLTLFGSAIVLSLSSHLCLADSYRGELGFDYTNDEQDVDTGQLGFKWYFQPVTTSFNKMFKKSFSHPLAEAAFLEKASSMSINYNMQHFSDVTEFSLDRYDFAKSDIKDIDLNAIDKLDLSTTKAEIAYFVPNSIFYVGVQFYRTTLETSVYNSTDVNIDKWGITGGLMVTDNFLITTHYVEDQDSPINCGAKYVAKLNDGAAINFLASYSRVDKNVPPTTGNDIQVKKENILDISADYYFNRDFSIGTGLIYAEKTGYELRSQYFFTESISFRAMFRTVDENNTFALGTSVRL